MRTLHLRKTNKKIKHTPFLKKVDAGSCDIGIQQQDPHVALDEHLAIERFFVVLRPERLRIDHDAIASQRLHRSRRRRCRIAILDRMRLMVQSDDKYFLALAARGHAEPQILGALFALS